jgi:outer membrane protein assembly factor BamA
MSAPESPAADPLGQAGAADWSEATASTAIRMPSTCTTRTGVPASMNPNSATASITASPSSTRPAGRIGVTARPVWPTRAGDNSFTSVKGEYSVYAKLAEDVLGRKTVLQLTTRAAHILQDSEEVPFYEQYTMGGQSFRGFRFRGVSPMGLDRSGVQTDDPVGGTFSFYAGAELRHPLYEDLLAGVLFLDTGTVDDDVSLEKYRVAVGFGFRLYIEQLSPIPLAFDFGIPVMKEETDRKRLFTFSIDVPFK